MLPIGTIVDSRYEVLSPVTGGTLPATTSRHSIRPAEHLEARFRAVRARTQAEWPLADAVIASTNVSAAKTYAPRRCGPAAWADAVFEPSGIAIGAKFEAAGKSKLILDASGIAGPPFRYAGVAVSGMLVVATHQLTGKPVVPLGGRHLSCARKGFERQHLTAHHGGPQRDLAVDGLVPAEFGSEIVFAGSPAGHCTNVREGNACQAHARPGRAFESHSPSRRVPTSQISRLRREPLR